jgi:gamma-glutamylcyclotransferase (GGCT)/AIG2-like uncharacterized protein YtfP
MRSGTLSPSDGEPRRAGPVRRGAAESDRTPRGGEERADRPLPLFFFGTLMDPDVLGLVIGRPVARAALEPARLSGFRRLRVEGASYPMLVADPQGVVEGRLWRGATAADLRRLDAYEGEGYERVPIEVETASGERLRAEVYLARPGRLRPSGEPWDLASWQARFKRHYLAHGEELVGAELP